MVSTALTVSAQKRKIDLWGHVYDQVTHHAIRGAKATLMLADSTVVDSANCGYFTGGYYGTDANYCFAIPRKPQRYIIRVTHPDYEPCFVDYEVKTPGRNTYFDAPWHYMKRNNASAAHNAAAPHQSAAATDSLAAPHLLGEVVVKGTRIKMAYKNDTIVYNASAFQLPDGSMLDALVRQMPGVELKDDGTILVNGEKVDFLTLNGKDFFKGKNKVMLENLPMYAVENVKVYRKSTEKSEWLGREVEKKNFVMDVHLKREYNQGYMANAEAAEGTEDRYTGRLFGLRFTDASRLSAFVNTNNVNETRRPGQNGEWTPDKALGNGMNKTVNAGFDLNIDDKKKRWDENITANLEYNRKQWNATELRETFASGGSLFSNSHEWGGNKVKGGDVTHRFRWKNMFSPLKLTLQQWVQWGRSESDNHTETAQWQNTDTLNLTRGNTSASQPYTWKMGATNILNYRMPWGDDLELNLMATYTRERGGEELTSTLYHYPHWQRKVLVGRRVRNIPANQYRLNAQAAYTIHALNNWNYQFSAMAAQAFYRTDQQHALADSLGLMHADPANTQRYNTLMRNGFLTLQTYYSKQEGDRYTWFNMSVSGMLKSDRIDYHHARLDTIARYTDRFVTYNANFVRNTARHGYEVRLMTSVSSVNHVRERIPIYSTVDPLLITLHNPHLGHSRNHHLLWTLRTTVPERQQNLTLNGRATSTLNKIGQRQGYNTTTGAFTQMLDNVSRPSWSLNQEAHFNRPLDTKKRLALDAHSRINYEEDNDFDVVQYSASNGQSAEALLKSAPRSTVRTLLNTEDLRLTYRIDRFDLAATGHFAYRHSTSNRANFTTLNIYEYNYGFAINCRLPWKLQLAADAKMYSRRGYYSAAMNTDDLVCNASLSRSFLKEMLTVRLEAFDLFHQLRSTEYTLNAQGRVEIWRKSIPSYLMLHVGWRWSHMPKKKSQRT